MTRGRIIHAESETPPMIPCLSKRTAKRTVMVEKSPIGVAEGVVENATNAPIKEFIALWSRGGGIHSLPPGL